MGTLYLTEAEVDFLVLTLNVNILWPQSEMELTLLKECPDEQKVAGGPEFRARLINLNHQDVADKGTDGPLPFQVTTAELWMLDTHLLKQDLRIAKLPDGAPLMEFAEKIWALILVAYKYEREDYHAGTRHEEEDKDPRSYVARAEALLGPGHHP